MYKYTRKLQCFTEFYFKPPIYWKAANFAVRVTASKYFYLQQSAEKKEEKRKKNANWLGRTHEPQMPDHHTTVTTIIQAGCRSQMFQYKPGGELLSEVFRYLLRQMAAQVKI